MVSHDRDFLDQTVTKILAFEGNAQVDTMIGGYSDYLEMKAKKDAPQKPKADKKPSQPKTETAKETAETSEPAPKQKRVKLTYKLERELKLLPAKIERTEKAIQAFKDTLGDADFYQRDPDAFHQTTKDLAEAEATLERYEIRWLDLEEQ